MATFISLVNFTDQGIRSIKESPARYDALCAMAEKMGVKVVGAHYTLGKYDLVLVFEGSDENAMATLLKTASLGNVRAQTLRAFPVDEMRKIIGSIP